MKQAKRRLLPSIQILIRSTRRATRTVGDAIAYVDASNSRIARMERRADKFVKGKVATAANREAASRLGSRLEELMAQIPSGARFEEFDAGPPVGREVM